mgnify:CR=1 FL=1
MPLWSIQKSSVLRRFPSPSDWDPTLTAGNIPLLENADLYDGPGVQLADNTEYCVHARFCMARGTVWQLTEDSGNPEAHDLAVHESMYCPSGRLKLWDKEEEKFYEPPLKPALGLIEDPQEECSGPLWVKGGIPVNGPDGTEYEHATGSPYAVAEHPLINPIATEPMLRSLPGPPAPQYRIRRKNEINTDSNRSVTLLSQSEFQTMEQPNFSNC